MKRFEIADKDFIRKNYRVYKGYSVKTKDRKEDLQQHFIVPWELIHDDRKKPFC